VLLTVKIVPYPGTEGQKPVGPAGSRSGIVSAMTSSDLWDSETAERYDETSAEMFDPAVLDPAVDFLARLAGDGRALELAIGTGRVAVPLAARGVPVSGIELSQPMVDQLRRKVTEDELPVLVGDMARTRVPGEFSLVYVVFNSIGNLRTQAEQVACFRNAARHLAPGGAFVIELWIPGIRRFPPGQTAVPFHVDERHVGFDTYELTTQQGTSHHYSREADGTTRYAASNFRYIWPAECDLMAQLAGMELEQRCADWVGSPFTSASESHVSVWRKLA
jgi:SAM-dependent methyltransferase